MNKSTGDSSTGDGSTGDRSTGDRSTGYRSTGDYSTGHESTGDSSTGYRSTGYRSTGNYSTGDKSTGDHSTGDRSTGDRSTGNWSISDKSTGDFSVYDGDYQMFDKTCSKKEYEAHRPEWLYFSIMRWVNKEAMTEKEKEDNPTYLTTLGYSKRLSFKEAAFTSWKNTTDEDRRNTLKLTNFNDVIFKYIFDFSAIEYLEGEGDE